MTIPITSGEVNTAFGIVKGASAAYNKLSTLYKNTKDRDTKDQIAAILDQLHELKHDAAKLEDENSALKEALRFKSDEYEFRTPFWYHKNNPSQGLCAKCFSENIAAPMGELGQGVSDRFRQCLVCGKSIEVVPEDRSRNRVLSSGGPSSWMG